MPTPPQGPLSRAIDWCKASPGRAILLALGAAHLWGLGVRIGDVESQIAIGAAAGPTPVVSGAEDTPRIVDSLRQRAFADLVRTYDSLGRAIRASSDSIAQLRETKARIEAGKPEQVALEDAVTNLLNGASFETARGPIVFRAEDVAVVRVPSTQRVAYFRIGKRGSTLQRTVIKAWLDEAAAAKVAEGYRLTSKRTGRAEYGDFSEAIYRKGDLFFRTYFEFSRVAETYGRHSLEYTFFSEAGSTEAQTRARQEGYTSRLGS
jgi:hypothetical protein